MGYGISCIQISFGLGENVNDPCVAPVQRRPDGRLVTAGRKLVRAQSVVEQLPDQDGVSVACCIHQLVQFRIVQLGLLGHPGHDEQRMILRIVHGSPWFAGVRRLTVAAHSIRICRPFLGKTPHTYNELVIPFPKSHRKISLWE